MNILFLVHIEDAMRPCMGVGYPERDHLGVEYRVDRAIVY